MIRGISPSPIAFTKSNTNLPNRAKLLARMLLLALMAGLTGARVERLVSIGTLRNPFALGRMDDRIA